MKDIVSLRNHLFDALNRLSEASTEELDSEIQRSASIVQVSEAIIKTAEVENTFIAITKAVGSGFIPVISDRKSLIEIIKRKAEEKEQTGSEEIFDVDKEKNWLANEGDLLQNNSIGMNTVKQGKQSND